jgi:hypothetical protein
MSQSQVDLDVNNYTDAEIFGLFKLDPAKCTTTEVDACISDSLFQLADSPHGGVYRQFFAQCKNIMVKKIGERTKAYDGSALTDAAARVYRPLEPPPPDTLHINYSTQPSNYNAFHRESEVYDGGYAKRNIAPVINAYNYKYPTGVLNPIERRVIKRLLSMDTLFRINYDSSSSTNASWVLPYPVENVVSMKIASVQLPNMWYAFSEATKSNRFTVIITGLNVAPYIPTEVYTNEIVIPDGNYLSEEFVECMNHLFKNTENGMEFFQIAINAYTSKVMLFQTYSSVNQTNSPNLTYMVVFDNHSKYDKYYSTCLYDKCELERMQHQHEKEYYNANIKSISKTAGWMMGFKQPVYNRTWANERTDLISQVPAVTYRAYLEGESSYGSTVWHYVYVDVDDYNKNFITNSIIAQTGDSYLGFNILGRITVSSGHLTIVNDHAGDMMFKSREYLGPVRLEKLTIRLLDKFGNVIMLNQNDYSIALELEVLYN